MPVSVNACRRLDWQRSARGTQLAPSGSDRPLWVGSPPLGSGRTTWLALLRSHRHITTRPARTPLRLGSPPSSRPDPITATRPPNLLIHSTVLTYSDGYFHSYQSGSDYTWLMTIWRGFLDHFHLISWFYGFVTCGIDLELSYSYKYIMWGHFEGTFGWRLSITPLGSHYQLQSTLFSLLLHKNTRILYVIESHGLWDPTVLVIS